MYSDAHFHSTHLPRAELKQDGLYLSCSASAGDWQNLLNDSRIVPFLGIHPERIASSWKEELERLEELLLKNPRAGLGECGLDKRFYRSCSRNTQEQVLRAHFRLASKYNRPVTLHQVGAPGALADFLSGERRDVPVMVHGFHGSKEILKRYLKRGLYISLGPGSHWEKPEFSLLIRSIPLQRLLVETDWPYGGQKEGVSYSRFLKELYSGISSRLGIDKTELAGIVKRNGEIFTH